MSETTDNLKLEIGHVLFLDIVGYSKLLIEEQRERLNQLTEIVLATPQVKASSDEQLVKLPTGDGMALVFRQSSEEPARCALEVAEALRKHPELPVRMGIHSGPVSEVTDVSGRRNIAGAGINMAQRVMDCGDAGHILLSQRVADDLSQYRQWAPRLHDLGECEVKHGVRLHLVNLYAEQIGNPACPQKFQGARAPKSITETPKKSNRLLLTVLGLLALCLIVVAIIFTPAVLKSLSRSKNERSAAPIADIPDKSVAVVPLVNTGGDPKNEYFSDGLSEELIAALAKIPGLKVIGRGSSFFFKGKSDDSATIGQKLGVAQLVEGSVRREGDRARIVASLIKAKDGQELWSETYDKELKDIFAVQSEIAQAVATQLKVKLMGDQATTNAAPSSDQHLAAYDAILRAKFQLRVGTAAATQQAIKEAGEATKLDPNYAAAWAILSRGWRLWAASFDTANPQASYAKARSFADKATSLDPQSVDALIARHSIALSGDLDFAAGENYARQALKIAPNDAVAQGAVGNALMAQGRLEEAGSFALKAIELEPLQNATWFFQGLRMLGLGRYDEAEKDFRKVLELQPDAARAHANLAGLAMLQNHPERALQEAQLENPGFWRDYTTTLALQAGDDRTRADEALQKFTQQYARAAAFQIAVFYAVRKQPEEMFKWLDTAYANRDGGLTQLVTVPVIMKYRDDPRMIEFCRKLKVSSSPK